MSNDTPWSSEESLSRLGRQNIGHELAAMVAEKLRKDEGKRGLWNSHRDYCGHGLIYRDAQYRLVEVRDGNVYDGRLLKAWHSTDDFIAWLERQSDYSLSGADEREPDLYTNVPFDLNNQRITQARLKDYVHDCTAAMAPFRDFLFALDLEFRFLADEHGFSKVRPRMDGRECVVRYRNARVGAISVVAEFRSTPFITFTSRSDTADKTRGSSSLDAAAKHRVPGWTPPEISFGEDVESAYRRYFRAYAALLRQHFPDVLLPPETDSV